jgi:hypothetical protein
MARQLNQALWDQWRQRLKRQRESGLSIAAFCRRENLSPHGFHAWKRKLRKATAGEHASRRATAAQPSRRRQGVVLRRRGLAKAAVLPRPTDFLQLPVASAPPSPWIELSLSDGTVVRLPQQNVAALLAVLRVLRGEPVDLRRAEGGDA